MKIRILPLLGLMFALVFVSRAFALSSGVISHDVKATTANTADTETGHSTKETSNTEPNHNQDKQQNLEQQCVTGDVLVSINNKMVTLKEREDELSEKESAFLAIEKRLNKQLLAVNAAKASLDASVKDRTATAQADITHLTLMYQTMKPKQAAKIFNEMDVNFAAGFLRKMKGAQAGLILSNMDAKKAYQISVIIASHNAKYRQSDNSLP